MIPADQDVAKLADILNGSEKITILAGSGCAGAHDAVVSLAKRLEAPVVPLRGRNMSNGTTPSMWA